MGKTKEELVTHETLENRLPGKTREELVNLVREAFGMWSSREDISDAVEYVRQLRESWSGRLDVNE
ncbi:MAG: hypothetical protein ACREOW_18370 [Thermodesulfobacteriota bacterium]